jgi:hypothetical protein
MEQTLPQKKKKKQKNKKWNQEEFDDHYIILAQPPNMIAELLLFHFCICRCVLNYFCNLSNQL